MDVVEGRLTSGLKSSHNMAQQGDRPMPDQFGNYNLIDALRDNANNQNVELSSQDVVEVTDGLLGYLTQQNQKPKHPIDNIFDALRAMANK